MSKESAIANSEVGTLEAALCVKKHQHSLPLGRSPRRAQSDSL